MSTPQTTIHICSGVRLDPRYEHTIYFDSKGAQEVYFAGKVVKTFPAYSFIRKTFPLQVEATMEQAKTWNYLYFRNGSGAKTYYYFITNVEYKNDSMVELTLELDVLQTYLFDFELLDCFIERQHTETDEIGEHCIDEGLEVGELVDNPFEGNLPDHFTQLQDLCILILSSINPNHAEGNKPIEALAGRYNGVFSGLKVWAVDSSRWADWGNQLDNLSQAGFLSNGGIVAMWMYPKALVKLGGEDTWSNDTLCKAVDGAYTTGVGGSFENFWGSVDGYFPKNNKVLQYPYNFLYVTNNQGGSAVYRYERFKNNRPYFCVSGSVSPDGTVKMYPEDYNGIEGGNYEQGLSMGNFPVCAWDADVYKLWLAQNQNQQNVSTVSAGLKIAGGAIAGIAGLSTGNFAVAGSGALVAVNGVQQIAEMLAQRKDMQIQPPQAQGSFSSSVNITVGKQNFTFYLKSVSAEQGKVIDDYFTMYGYKINQVKKPNLHARPGYTYIKTVGCHIKGNMCTDDIIKIESIFDKGITFWVNGDSIGEYRLVSNRPKT